MVPYVNLSFQINTVLTQLQKMNNLKTLKLKYLLNEKIHIDI